MGTGRVSGFPESVVFPLDVPFYVGDYRNLRDPGQDYVGFEFGNREGDIEEQEADGIRQVCLIA